MIGFVRERVEVYGPSIMTYGDNEGINRYLGLGSLRPVTNPVNYQKKQQPKSANVCWRFNGLGRCRSNCRFRHACDYCGEGHPCIECRSSGTSNIRVRREFHLGGLHLLLLVQHGVQGARTGNFPPYYLLS